MANASRESPNAQQELETLKMCKFFPFETQKGWAVVMTMDSEATFMRLNELGEPLDKEWQTTTTAPSSNALTNKYQVARHAKQIWTAAGNTTNTPCYSVRIREGWLAIFGGYCKTITVLVDTNGVAYDTTWIE